MNNIAYKLLNRLASFVVSLVTTIRMFTGWSENKLVGVVILAKTDSKISERVTQMCITSICVLNRTRCAVVVIESGQFTKYKNAEVITPDVPFGYNEFMCIGIEHLRSQYNPDYYLLINNDVVVLSRSIDTLVCSGVASASPVDPTKEEQFGIPRPTLGYSIRYHVLGWALFVRADLISHFGCEQLFPRDIRFYWQDNHYSDFIRHYCIKHYVIPRAQMIHLESATTTSDVTDVMLNNGDYETYMQKINLLNP